MRAFLFLALVVSLSGCNNGTTTEKVVDDLPKPKAIDPKPIPAEFPMSIPDAELKLKGLTKEQVIAYLGKPDVVGGPSDIFYRYRAPRYLKPDIGSRNEAATGMDVMFLDGKVRLVTRPQP